MGGKRSLRGILFGGLVHLVLAIGQGMPEGSPVPPSPLPVPPQVSPSAPPSSSPQPKAEVLDPGALERLLKGVRERVDLLTTTASYDPLIRPLWDLVKKGVRVRVLATQSSVDAPASYLVALSFLSLRHSNLEVKLVRGSRVDPRLFVDGRYMVVGQPLDGVPPEVGGPLLLFTEPGLVGAELARFEAYWRVAPYCAPRARYDSLRGVLATCVPAPARY